jgi:hypothetical protein
MATWVLISGMGRIKPIIYPPLPKFRKKKRKIEVEKKKEI